MNPYKDINLGKAGVYEMIGHPAAKSVTFKAVRTFNSVKYAVDVLVGFDGDKPKIAWEPTLQRIDAAGNEIPSFAHPPTDAAIKKARTEVNAHLMFIEPEHIATLDEGKRHVDRERLNRVLDEAAAWNAHLETQLERLDNGDDYDAYPDREEVEKNARARGGETARDGAREGGEGS